MARDNAIRRSRGHEHDRRLYGMSHDRITGSWLDQLIDERQHRHVQRRASINRSPLPSHVAPVPPRLLSLRPSRVALTICRGSKILGFHYHNTVNAAMAGQLYSRTRQRRQRESLTPVASRFGVQFSVMLLPCFRRRPCFVNRRRQEICRMSK